MRYATMVLALLVLVASSGCLAFMDGYCEKGNKPGGYCERYNQQRAQESLSPTPQPASAPDPLGCAMLYAAGNQQGMMAAGCPPPYGGYQQTTDCVPNGMGGYRCTTR